MSQSAKVACMTNRLILQKPDRAFVPFQSTLQSFSNEGFWR